MNMEREMRMSVPKTRPWFEKLSNARQVHPSHFKTTDNLKRAPYKFVLPQIHRDDDQITICSSSKAQAASPFGLRLT
jgi:hypothetical protein